MKRFNVIATLALIATVGPLTACSGTSSPGAVAAPTPSAPTVITPSPTSTLSAFEAACAQDVLLQFLKNKFDNPATEMIIERADLRRCRDGYAHVYAVTQLNPSGSARYENEQLFLRFVNGEWQSVAEGTGMSCENDRDRFPELAAACSALGY